MNPPKNLRKIKPRCCAWCKHNIQREYILSFGNVISKPVCERDPDEIYVCLEDEQQYHTVCDYFKR